MPAEYLAPGFRFAVHIFAGGAVPNPIDLRFKRVSGLEAAVQVSKIRQGGENSFPNTLPLSVDHGNLVLERGMVVGSPLNLEFAASLSLFKFMPSNVLVTTLDDDKAPTAGWLFLKAFPVRWATSDLDAGTIDIAVDTLEFAYERMQFLRV